MARSKDTEVWDYAAEHGYTIVSKDADFHQRSLLHGAPPKVIWVRQGNCSVSDTAMLLRASLIAIEHLHVRGDEAFLTLP